MTGHETQQSAGTQLLSQWVFDNSKNGSHDTQASRSTGDNTATLTPHQKGYTKLVEPSQGDPITQDVDIEITPFADRRRFMQEDTPASHGRKRWIERDTAGPEFTTPRLPSNPFGRVRDQDENVMGLSQVFKATQAPSSPTAFRLPQIPSSERPSPGAHIFDRSEIPSDMVSVKPSPTVIEVERPITAPGLSPLGQSSKLSKAGLKRSVTEPHAQWPSRKESQEARERRLWLANTSSSAEKELDAIDIAFSDTSDLTREYKKRKIAQEAKAVFRSITAPIRPSVTNKGTQRLQSSRIISHPPRTQTDRDTIIISDDGGSTGSEDETEYEADEVEETAEAIEHEDEDSSADEDKENRQVYRVGSPTGFHVKRKPTVKRRSQFSESPSINRERILVKENDSEDELARRVDDEPSGSMLLRRLSNQEHENVAIADSQSSQRRVQASSREGKVVSSNDSRKVIPQSQVGRPNGASQITSSATRKTIGRSSQQIISPPTSSPSSQQKPKPMAITTGDRQDIQEDEIRSRIPLPSSSPPRLFENQVNLRSNLPPPMPSTNIETRGRVTPGQSTRRNLRDSNSHLKFSSGERETHRTPLSRETRLESTIPETISQARREPIGIDREVPLSSTAAATAVSDAHRSNKDTSTTHVSEPLDGRSVGGIDPLANSQPQNDHEQELPLKALLRIPKPFTSIGPIAHERDDEEDNGEDGLDLLAIEDDGFRDELDRYGGSSPIPLGRKRKRGPNRRDLVQEDPSSSLSKSLTSAPNVVSREPQLEAHPPSTDLPGPSALRTDDGLPLADTASTDQIDELATGTPTSSPCKKRKIPSRASSLHVSSRVNQRPTKHCSMPTVELEGSLTSRRNGGLKRPSARLRTPSLSNTKEHQEVAALGDPSLASSVEVEGPTPVASTRVFAWFDGSQQGYFPATCLGPAIGFANDTYKIRFDDGNIGVLNASKIKRLELKAGDNVKIYREGQRKQSYIVTETSEKMSEHDLQKETYPLCDIFGNQKVTVSLKQKASKGKIETVSIAEVYLTVSLWKGLKDRTYFHMAQPTLASGIQTPTEYTSTPGTPASRTRSARLSTHVPINRHATAASHLDNGIFSGIFFCLTMVGEDDRKKWFEDQVKSNGGTVVSDSFASLFNVPSKINIQQNPESNNASPLTGPSSPAAVNSTSSFPAFTLNQESTTARFAVLLSNTYRRTTKYFQALALGIPCLSARWVKDCVDTSGLRDWRPYLLAAGESTYLKSICSQTLLLGPGEDPFLGLRQLFFIFSGWI